MTRSSQKCEYSGHRWFTTEHVGPSTAFCLCNRLLTLKPGASTIPSHKRPI